MRQIRVIATLVLAGLACTHGSSDVPEPLVDGRLITSPSTFVGGLSQLKLVAGYASNASLTEPSGGFKYVQCSVSYGTWILQIQAETERALTKTTNDRRRIRSELEGVKQGLYGLLGHRDTEKNMQNHERRQAIVRHREMINESLRKATQAITDAQKNLNPPKLMLEEMEGALARESSTQDDSYCRDDPIPIGAMGGRHRNKAIDLLKQSRRNWESILELHRYIQTIVASYLDLGERALLQHRIEVYSKDQRISTHEFQLSIAPIVRRMLKFITLVKAVEDAYAAQNLVQRYAKMPIISARRNDTDICREYNRMATELATYNVKARETLNKSVRQQ